jgi:glucokinase
LGIDLGGSSFKCGLISPEWKIVARNEAPTDALHGPAQAADRMAHNVRALQTQLPAGGQLGTIGICSAGPIDITTGTILEPPNLTGWRNVPFAQMVSERVGLPVVLEHDAKGTALAEYHFGAGRGAKSMALIIVGTGVGSAMIVNGQLYRGPNGSAGEIGHITVDMDGPICRCGATGCVEAFAGGPAILDAYNFATRRGVESGEAIVQAAQQGDEIARRVFARAGRALGAALATMAMLNDIERFVMFGSGIKAGDLVLDPVRAAIPRYSYRTVGARVQLVLAELGNDAGILGAAWSAEHKQ